VILTLAAGKQPLPLVLLADTGAGSTTARFDLVLDESDCLLCGGKPSAMVHLEGAYAGDYPVYQLRVKPPELAFSR
jgi:hypothetical protein